MGGTSVPPGSKAGYRRCRGRLPSGAQQLHASPHQIPALSSYPSPHHTYPYLASLPPPLLLQGAEDKHSVAMSKMKEGWAAELRRQREGWAATEKGKREVWMEAKTREVKEVTVKGLEQEVRGGRAGWKGDEERGGRAEDKKS